MKFTTECSKCGGGTGQVKACSCAVDAKSNNEWVPEVGDKCLTCFPITVAVDDLRDFVELEKGSEVEINGKANFGHGDAFVFSGRINGYWFYASHKAHAFSPAKTEAEKRRDLAVGELASDIGSMGLQAFDDPWMAATELHEKGYIKPKPLTDGVIEKLHHPNSKVFAARIESFILGERP